MTSSATPSPLERASGFGLHRSPGHVYEEYFRGSRDSIAPAPACGSPAVAPVALVPEAVIKAVFRG